MKIAICDDETIFTKNIMHQVKFYFRYRPLECIDIYSSGEEILKAYKEGKRYDVILMDVQMTGISGTEAAEKIRKIDHKFALVFITNYQNYIFEAVRAEPLGYLSKPTDNASLSKILKTCEEKYKQLNQITIWPINSNNKEIEIYNIIYIKSENKKIFVHMDDGEILEADKKIKDAAQELRKLQPYFVQCHKSYIINMRYIFDINNNFIMTKNNEKIPLGRVYAKEVRRLFNITNLK